MKNKKTIRINEPDVVKYLGGCIVETCDRPIFVGPEPTRDPMGVPLDGAWWIFSSGTLYLLDGGPGWQDL